MVRDRGSRGVPDLTAGSERAGRAGLERAHVNRREVFGELAIEYAQGATVGLRRLCAQAVVCSGVDVCATTSSEAVMSAQLLLELPGTRVLLIGSGSYLPGSRFPALPSVSATVRDLGRVLVERAGLDPARLNVVLDPADPRELGADVVEAANQATDVLMIYFVGHGAVSDGELHLTTRAARDLAEGIAAHQALPYAEMSHVLARTRAPLTVVILDCCFSGRARARGRLDEVFDAAAAGMYVLTATGANGQAWAPPDEPHTAFTGALIKLLTDGDPAGPAQLTLEDVYRSLSAGLHGRGLPRPRRQAADYVDQLPLASNRAYVSAVPSPPVFQPGDFSPYRGLASFGPEDARYFFGRQELTAALRARVETASGLVLVTGPSGAGKSSLLHTGLARWLGPVSVITPGEDPIGSLADRFQPLDGPGIRSRLEAEPGHLRDMLASAGRPVLIVDQFEEVFTACSSEEQRRIFIRALHTAGESARIVVGLRADFFGHCAAYPELLESMERPVVVTPMTADQLRETIEGPARLAGLTLQPGLVELLLEDIDGATGAAVLPLLSHALLATWQHREGRMLTLAGYRTTGGISRALARSADSALADLDADARHAARLLLPRLVRIGDEFDDSRRPMTVADLLPSPTTADYAPARRALDQLVRARLVTVDRDRAQLTHEALIRRWPQLNAWIAADRTLLMIEQQIAEDARDWLRSGRDPAFLYRDTRLAMAQDAANLGELEDAFLAASRALEAAGKAAARRRQRTRTLLTAALAVLLIVALGMTARLVAALDEAGQERDLALSRELQATSQALARTDPVVSRLLLVAAWRLSPRPAEVMPALKAAALRPEVAVLNGQGDAASSLAFSPDGKVLAIGSDTTFNTRIDRVASVQLWDLATRTPIGAPLLSQASTEFHLAFSPDGRTLAVARAWEAGAGDGTPGEDVRLWDVATQRQYGSSITFDHDPGRLGSGPIRSMAFSPDGKTVLLGRGNTTTERVTVQLWNTDTGAVHVLTGPTGLGVLDWAGFSAGGTFFAAAVSGETDAHPRVLVWRTGTRDPVALPRGRGDVRAAAFTPDDGALGVLRADGQARWLEEWDLITGRRAGPAYVDPPAGAGAMAFSRDGRTLAAADVDGVRLWDRTSRRPLTGSLTGHGEPVGEIAFSPDGATLAGLADPSGHDSSGAGDVAGQATVTLWDVGSLRPVGEPLIPSSDFTWALAFNHDGSLLASGGTGGGAERGAKGSAAQVWRVDRRELMAEVARATRVRTSYNVAFDGSDTLTVWSGVQDAGWSLSNWDLRSRKPIGTVTRDPRGVGALVVLNPAGSRHLIMDTRQVSDPGGGFHTRVTVRAWDRDTGKSSRLLVDSTGDVGIPAFSADGRQFITTNGLLDGVGAWQVWDTATLRPLYAPRVDATGDMSAAAFSADGRTVITVTQTDEKAALQLWDVATGTWLGAPLVTDEEVLTFLAPSPDGRSLATVGLEGKIRFWTLGITDARAVRMVCDQAGRALTKAERDRYLAGRTELTIC
ncbi:caspase family protein [Streptosporangiaceae bacterium NEAU-GS5]|nr:caspase family protein [Streptosporangiaceae bacterium NEAU-GS5]